MSQTIRSRSIQNMIRVSSFSHNGLSTKARVQIYESETELPKVVEVEYAGTLSREEIVKKYEQNLPV